MAGDGVRVATAFIELNVDDSSVTDTVKGALDDAGSYAKDAGRKMGQNLSTGAKSAMGDLTRSIADAGKKGAKQLSDEVSSGMRKGAKDARTGFEREFKAMVDNSAKGLGKKLSDAISSSGASQSLRDIANQAAPIIDTVNGVSSALKGIRDHDAGAALNGVADALGKIGQTGAAGVIKDLGDKVGETQDKAGKLKGDIEGTTTSLLTLTNNSGKIAGGLSAISAAAGPLAATFAALSTFNPAAVNALGSIFDQLQGKKPFNLKDWANGLIPGTTFLDRPIKDIFGNSPLKPGKAPSTPSSGFTPSDFLPGGSSQRNFYKDWYGGASTDGNNGVIQPDSTGGLLGIASPSGMTGTGSRAAAVPAGLANGGAATLSPGSWQQIDAIASQFGLSMTSGFRDPNGPTIAGVPASRSYHGSGRAHDYSGSPQQMRAFADYMAANYSPQLKELIFDQQGFGSTIHNGGVVGPFGSFYTLGQAGDHSDHVHIAYDEGGPVPGDLAAWLHSGEHVLDAADVNAMGGQSGVNAFREALHAGSGAPPGPSGDSPDDALARTLGYLPAAAEGNAGGVAGTSSLAGLFSMGNDVVSGLIDTGASAAQMAVSAAVTGAAAAGSFGAGAAAGQAASAAASYGIQLAATQGKRLSSYGFQMAAIGADALVEQLFPFGAPRWLGYDYTQFVPQLNISEIGTTTAEKAVQQQLQAQGAEGAPTGLDAAGMASQQPGGPVNASLLPGSQPVGPPTPQFGSNQPVQAPSAPPGTGPGGSAPSVGPPKPMGPPSPSSSKVPMPMDFIPRPQTTVNPTLPQNPMLPIPTMESLLFDDGGPWPSGTWGYNGTGRDEFVLSPADLDAMTTRPAAQEYAGRGGDTYIVQGYSPDEIARYIAGKQRLRSLQHTGRPTGL
ncbi:hypothetical protein [Mycobacterium gordonae]|uniref:hypothetical protein n=1 Tax=Mycobacterium gordonae TaxID=1778 RepID=UPI000848E0F7|nr:hypothetical protein [Mycobacterium gordonae]ODR20728.1 hypothetical protein BHQ23_14970 [Mycobacterium gordonae]